VIYAAEFGGADLVMIVAILVLLVGSLLLAIAETALTRISKAKAVGLAEEGRRGSKALVELVEHPEAFLNPVLLVVLVFQLVQSALTGIVADRLLGPWGVAAGVFINVVVVFIVAEAGPKTWAVQHPETAALASAGPVLALTRFPPLRLLSRALIGLTNVILPGKGLKNGPYVSEEELLALADVAVEEAVIEERERALIESIIEFGDTIVREVMVPRPDMVTVPADFRVADVMEIIIMNGYSRLPAYGEGVDDIVGVVYAKDLLKADRDGQVDAEIAGLLRPARFVPETKRIADLLREMQAESFHMAIVVDEYGGTAGVVTLEDLIEELVGEIVDEYDREEAMVEPVAGGDVRVNARMSVDELNGLLKASLPTGDWDSVGGLMFHLLGHIPVEGETVEADGFVLRADRVQGRRINRVGIMRVGSTDDDGGDEPDGRSSSRTPIDAGVDGGRQASDRR